MGEIILVQEEPRGASQLLECPVVAGATKQRLPDNNQLRSVVGQTIIIKGIRLITDKVLADAVNFALPNAILADLVNMVLVLYCEGWERAQMIPLLVLNDMADGDAAAATTIPYRNKATKFDNWRSVDWAKSFFQFTNGNAASTDFAVIFDIEYVKLDSNNQPIVGPS
jgi:hypothetical protein